MDRASLPGSGERTKRTEKAGKSKDWKSKKGGEASRAGRAERRVLPHSSSSPVFYKVPVCLMRHEINFSTDRRYLIAVIPLQNSVKSMRRFRSLASSAANTSRCPVSESVNAVQESDAGFPSE